MLTFCVLPQVSKEKSPVVEKMDTQCEVCSWSVVNVDFILQNMRFNQLIQQLLGVCLL